MISSEILSVNEIVEIASGRCLLLVSGGPDSVFLFHLFIELRSRHGAAFEVLHVNYGLRGPESDADEGFVRDLCRSHDVPLTVHRATLPGKADLQNRARRIRYRKAFALAAERGFTRVLTAHHRDDAIETLVLRARRGAGLKGLAGIARSRTVCDARFAGGKVVLLRPLLALPKERILTALAERNLAFRVDASNVTDRYERNRVRRSLAENPLSEERQERLLRLADALRKADAYFERRTRSILRRFRRFIPTDVWSSWPEELRFRVFRGKVRAAGFREQVGRHHFALFESAQDRMELGPARLFRDAAGVYFYTASDLESLAEPRVISGPGAYFFGLFGETYRFERSDGVGVADPGADRPSVRELILDADRLAFPLRLEIVGEFGREPLKSARFRAAGCKETSLKDYLQRKRVPRFRRLLRPVLKDAFGKTIAVPGVGAAEGVLAGAGTKVTLIVR